MRKHVLCHILNKDADQPVHRAVGDLITNFNSSYENKFFEPGCGHVSDRSPVR